MKPGDIQIGDTFTSNNFGRYRVGKMDGDHAWIVFEDTGNVEHPSLKMIVANGIVDYKGGYELRVGGLYNTSNYGKVKVLKITDSKTVKIKFVNTGYETVSQKHAILAGLLVDKLAQLIAAEDARREKEAKREAKKQAESEARRKAKELQDAEKEARRQEQEMEKLAIKETRRLLGSDGHTFMGTLHTDKLNFKFQVVDRKGLTATWIIKYLDSGNQYECSEGNIKRCRVYDTKHPDYFDLRAKYNKEQSALYYEANRERIIKMNSEYQKNNLDKARVRNQNRRTKRVGNEGTHTLDEVQFILESQNYKCACCSIDLDEGNKHLDHIYPLALGGTNYAWNLQWLCQFCNNSKSAAHPDDWKLYSKSEHFTERLKARGVTVQ